MNRALLRSTAFLWAAKRLLKSRPQSTEGFQTTLDLLAADAFHPQLKTHKLKGALILLSWQPGSTRETCRRQAQPDLRKCCL